MFKTLNKCRFPREEEAQIYSCIHKLALSPETQTCRGSGVVPLLSLPEASSKKKGRLHRRNGDKKKWNKKTSEFLSCWFCYHFQSSSGEDSENLQALIPRRTFPLLERFKTKCGNSLSATFLPSPATHLGSEAESAQKNTRKAVTWNFKSQSYPHLKSDVSPLPEDEPQNFVANNSKICYADPRKRTAGDPGNKLKGCLKHTLYDPTWIALRVPSKSEG